MPGSVVSVSTSVVMELSLSSAFEHSRGWPLRIDEYPNGESFRRNVGSTSRKSWRLSKRLTTAQLATLKAFYAAQNGPRLPFFIYDGTETTPAWSWDATGVSTVGRYTVRFANTSWQQAIQMGRHEVPALELIEVS